MGLVPGTSQLRTTLYDGVRFEKGVVATVMEDKLK